MKSRIDEDGHEVYQVIDWPPTRRVWLRGVGYGLVASFFAVISPIAIITWLLIWTWGRPGAAVAFVLGVGLLTACFYFVFMAGRGELLIFRDGKRSEEPVPWLSTGMASEPRDYWSEYDSLRQELKDLEREMKERGLDPKEADLDD